ncbi:hypothetical protein B0H34DRAFT_29266 [Crassisporium funariophilum]|nr:hypothetical protein B0H34DRAFT_29266 [Crassisporium funariophilum]
MFVSPVVRPCPIPPSLDMLRSVHSSLDPHDTHLRHLIDQRSNRADVQGRFSAISEYSDTPSVYSRAFFSPKPSDNGDHQNYQSDYEYSSPTAHSHRSDRDRLNDHTSSVLDLDDDPRSSFASESFHDDPATYEDEENEPTARMSYLGPKMRFHSRAPWEMDDNTLEEEEEPEEGHRPFASGFPFRGNGARSANSGSSSPRPSFATSRPSGESSRSQLPPKQSFETINSQVSYPRGALYALAQESMSSNSLERPAPQKATLRNKFSYGRLRAEPPNVALPPSPIPSPARTPIHGRFPPSPRDNYQSAHSFDTPPRSTTTSFANKNQSAPSEDNVHPYANPDLASSAFESTEFPTDTNSSYQPPSRNDSSMTITESYTTDSMSKHGARSILTTDTSMNSILSKHRMSTIQAKSISSPVSVIGPQQTDVPTPESRYDQNMNMLPPGVNNLPGWTDRNAPPTFSLISLEEARAQRVRSSTVNPASRISTASGASTSSTPFPPGEFEVSNGTDPSPFGTLHSRARGRSISAGAKARNALQTIVGQVKPDRRDSEPFVAPQPNSSGQPGKSLKHKKSGFMRLFNGNKLQEKDERDSPPPVPSLPDGHAFNNYQHVQQISKSSAHRIPVPSLSPSLIESGSAQSSDSLASDWKPPMPSPRRTPPTLSINTIPQGSAVRSSSSAVEDRRSQTRPLPSFTLDRPWQNDQQPQSAPANVSEFPALKLRPISTLFSAQFGEHIVLNTEPRSSDETELDTPRSLSPNGPVTPWSHPRTSNEQALGSAGYDDQSSLVRSLQEQLNTSKKAWQRHIWELEGQVRDLKIELDDLKTTNNDEHCQSCGRGKIQKDAPLSALPGGSVVHRPRARTGTSSRFGNALP